MQAMLIFQSAFSAHEHIFHGEKVNYWPLISRGEVTRCGEGAVLAGGDSAI